MSASRSSRLSKDDSTSQVTRRSLSKSLSPASSPPAKKIKIDPNSYLIYVVEKKISSAHLKHLKAVAEKNGFRLASSLSEDVTHIVTTLTSYDRLLTVISDMPPEVEVISLDWLTSCFVEGRPIEVTDRYRLRKPATVDIVSPAKEAENFQMEPYECQRTTTLDHHNKELTEALELLERYHLYFDHKERDTRALAYRQASCTLKAYPKKIESVLETANLPRIGKHSSQVIEDILTSGCSKEVEDCRKSEWFQCMEVFTTIYGCGPATADKWYHKGLRTIEDVKACPDLNLTETQKLGLCYHEELSSVVSRAETEAIVEFTRQQLEVCAPGTLTQAVGGYRRGKASGHDVDILLTHNDDSVVENLLETLLARLRKQGALIHSDYTTGHNTIVPGPTPNMPPLAHKTHGVGRVKFDHLDKAFCILSLPKSQQLTSTGSGVDSISDDLMIKRVDFIVAPFNQYPFALVSWTGSKQFNRSLKRYAAKELNMTLSAHGLYDNTKGVAVPATSEQEVFSLLKLMYREPWERNC